MLLTARRLFTGPTTGLLEDHVLEIDDDRIVDIRPRTEARTAGELTDFEDATLLPGLIDVHQHLAFDASADPVVRLDATTTPRCCCACGWRRTAPWLWASRRSATSVTAAAVHPAIVKRLSAILANHAKLYRLGARVVCSSDAGVGPDKPHDALPHGVTTFFPSLGMANAQAISNVTAFAAEVCGIADRTGTLEVGKDADILAVAGNPLEDITDVHRVVAVYARGRAAIPRRVAGDTQP
jgi:imidazolonepropionase-like amidohydrolase